eukprot:g16909.t1
MHAVRLFTGDSTAVPMAIEHDGAAATSDESETEEAGASFSQGGTQSGSSTSKPGAVSSTGEPRGRWGSLAVPTRGHPWGATFRTAQRRELRRPLSASGRTLLPLAAACHARFRRLRRTVAHGTGTSASAAAVWHAERRKEMLRRYGAELQALRGPDARTLPLLALANLAQLLLAIFAGQQLQESQEVVTISAVVLLAVGVGGTLSMWSFSVLHDLLHGTCVRTDRSTREALLFCLSFPTIFGYHLYLQRGHLSHHKNLGRASMGQIFDSDRLEFEDGDVLFVAHRQPLQGRPFEVDVGGLRFSPSISHNVMTRLWDTETPSDSIRAAKNAALYCFSMIFERCALADKIVALFGRNAFFLQKPAAFHDSCATYARTDT